VTGGGAVNVGEGDEARNRPRKNVGLVDSEKKQMNPPVTKEDSFVDSFIHLLKPSCFVLPTNSWHRNACGKHPKKTSHWDYDYMHSWDSALSENLKVTDVSRFFWGGGTGKWCQSFSTFSSPKETIHP